MNNPQYWTSLWGVVLFIFLAGLLMFGTVAVFVFLYDRLSALPIWNSPFWLRFKIPIIIVLVIGGLVTLIAFVRHEGHKELQIAQDYAEKQGWRFSRDVPSAITNRVEEILCGWDISLHNARAVLTGGRELWLFDCSYKPPEASAKSSYSNGVACLIQSNRFLPTETPVEIAARDWTEIMISDKVDMGNTPFASKFLVSALDAATANRLVNESIQAVMLEHMADAEGDDVSIVIGNRGAILLTGRVSEQAELHKLLALARRIEAVAK